MEGLSSTGLPRLVFGDSKSQRASKLHYWFKSYGDFAEWVDFAPWWSFIWKGLRLQAAQQACLREKTKKNGKNLSLYTINNVSMVLEIIAGPKRGRPTPGFSIFIRSDRASEQASYRVSFVSRDQFWSLHIH